MVPSAFTEDVANALRDLQADGWHAPTRSAANSLRVLFEGFHLGWFIPGPAAADSADAKSRCPRYVFADA